MKNFLIVTAIVTGIAGTSFAGVLEYTPVAEPELAAPTVTKWSGPYAGVLASMGSGQLTDHSFDGEVDYGNTYDIDGNMYGAFAGYNVQRGNMVFGLEGAYSVGSIGFENYGEGTWGAEFTSFIDLKARVGFAAGSALIYGFAGATASELHYFYKGDDYFSPSGWNYGAGIDMFVTNRFFVGADYIVRELSDDLAAFGEDWTMDATVNAVEVRIGMQF